ncbi:hypothetical protein WJX82_006251 [Trebouxia sp. C0006]
MYEAVGLKGSMSALILSSTPDDITFQVLDAGAAVCSQEHWSFVVFIFSDFGPLAAEPLASRKKRKDYASRPMDIKRSWCKGPFMTEEEQLSLKTLT